MSDFSPLPSAPAEYSPVTKKPKLDLDLECDDAWLYEVGYGRNGGEDEYTIDHIKTTEPDFYQVLVRMCGLALDHYQASNSGSYKVVSVNKLTTRTVDGYIFTITFDAQDVVDDSPAEFKAVGKEKLEVERCERLK